MHCLLNWPTGVQPTNVFKGMLEMGYQLLSSRFIKHKRWHQTGRAATAFLLQVYRKGNQILSSAGDNWPRLKAGHANLRKRLAAHVDLQG